jgi:5'-nucleotidase
MRILLTNDDGIRAPGLAALYSALSRWAPTEVVAPETHQSATGHGITLSTPLLTQKITVSLGDGSSFTGTAVDGRPADCTKLALSHIVTPAPDLVVSGMNAGANVGINVLYSGTCAAAIEAAFLGRPAVAVSLLLARGVKPDFAAASALAVDVIRKLFAAGRPRAGEVVSINIPALAAGESPRGLRTVRQCTRPWVDTYEKRTSPKTGDDYYWNNSVFTLGDTENDTDVAALREGYITVTPLMFDLTDHRALAELARVLP